MTDNDIVGTCHECGRTVIRQSAWIKATPQERADRLAQNQRLLKARGLCSPCYITQHKQGAFPKRQTGQSDHGTTPCQRCGISTHSELCQDCIDVTADLWAMGILA